MKIGWEQAEHRDIRNVVQASAPNQPTINNLWTVSNRERTS